MISSAMWSIVEYWYKTLEFPERYDAEFQEALNTVSLPDTATIEAYNTEEPNGKRNLIAFLYFCESLKQRYAQWGVPTEVLMATLYDLRRWTDVWSELKGELYLGELSWLSSHLRGKLFQLGALQFAMGQAETDVPSKLIVTGEPVIEVHIPAGTDLSQPACDAAFEQATEFFTTYFPDYEYRYFTCHSWLLDPTLKELLKPESKIIGFQNRFDVVQNDPSDATLKYIFRWDATREMLPTLEATTGLAKRIKEYAMNGGAFYTSLGVIDKKTLAH